MSAEWVFVLLHDTYGDLCCGVGIIFYINFFSKSQKTISENRRKC